MRISGAMKSMGTTSASCANTAGDDDDPLPQMIAAIESIDRRLASSVQIVRVIVDPDGTSTGQRILAACSTCRPSGGHRRSKL